jgi:hypothetical protein
MCLDPEARIVYVLDVFFFGRNRPRGRSTGHQLRCISETAIARALMQEFMHPRCGLVNAHAPCRCVR